MACGAPSSIVSPTPVTRLSGSWIFEPTKSISSAWFVWPSAEMKLTTIMKFLADLATRTPCLWTSCGSIGSASCSLFCTWTWAMSGSASGSSVMLTVTLPDESLVEDM